MSKTDGDAGNGGGAVEVVRVPQLVITFNPRTYAVTVEGGVPTLEFSKALLQMACDEVERQIQDKRTEGRIQLATADVLKSLQKW
jgi:hypothetical protein